MTTPLPPAPWTRVARRIGAVTGAFLDRLFELDPRAASAFQAADRATRCRRTVEVADAIVALLDAPEALAVAALPDYRGGADRALAADALLHALDVTLGGEWSEARSPERRVLHRLIAPHARAA